jgi:glycosyltransferase involved in cell wall biosynthesis
VDGGSTDQTLEVLRRYPHLRWISEPDNGQTEAINKGIRMGSGDIVAYLNADDVYRPGAFDTVAKVFAADPTTAVLVGDCDVIDDHSNLVRHHRARLDQFEDLLYYWLWGHRFCIPQPSVFLHGPVLDQVGLFDEQYDLAMDYEMWLRLAARYPFTIVHQTLAALRVNGQTKTNRYRHLMDLEQFRSSRKSWHLARPPDRWLAPCLGRAHAAHSWLALRWQRGAAARL